LAVEPGNRIRVIDRGAAARVRRVAAATAVVAAAAAAAAAVAVALQLHCECDRSIDYAGAGSLARSNESKESCERFRPSGTLHRPERLDRRHVCGLDGGVHRTDAPRRPGENCVNAM